MAITTAFGQYRCLFQVTSGGAPEGVLAAVALKCLGGDFQGMLLSQVEEITRCNTMEIQDINSVLLMEDIVKGEDAFFQKRMKPMENF